MLPTPKPGIRPDIHERFKKIVKRAMDAPLESRPKRRGAKSMPFDTAKHTKPTPTNPEND